MRSKAKCLAAFPVLFLLFSNAASAELSVSNKFKIEQAIHQCNMNGNALSYPDYWGDSVTDANRETVCIAERYAQLSVDEGDAWMENKAPDFIRQCREQSAKDEDKYVSCLYSGVQSVANQLSSPCKELGQEGLWDERRCQRLVSYIFITQFDRLVLDYRPLIEKVQDMKILQILFNPIAAILFVILYVIDIVLVVDPGNWLRISGVVLTAGIVILTSMFLPAQWRFFGMGLAILISTLAIMWNHLWHLFSPERKEKKKRQMTIRKLLG